MANGALDPAADLEESFDLSLDSLDDELILQCLAYLDAKDLSVVELTCSRMKRCIEEGKLWAKKCAALFPELAHLLDDIDTVDLERKWPIYQGKRERQQNAACKRLFACLAASLEPDSYSLICDPLAASSVDHPEEHLHRTLSPVVRGRTNVICYWSSAGSDDENSDEFITYRLCHPLCVVSSVSVRPFRAWFQGGSPIYAPKSISVGLGGIHLPTLPGSVFGRGKHPLGAIQSNLDQYKKLREEMQGTPSTITTKNDDDSSGGSSSKKQPPKVSCSDWMTLTKDYPIQQEDRLQTVQLPPRSLAIGGFLQINLNGRTQRQEQDDRYYTCLGYVKVQGRPIYNFRLVNTDPNSIQMGYYYDESSMTAPYRLKLDPNDFLKMCGGLSECSENGRCSKSEREAAQARGLPDPLDNFSGSEIGSDDMDLNIDEFGENDDDIL